MVRGPYALHAPRRRGCDQSRRLRDWRYLHRAQRAGAAGPRVTPLRRSLALRAVAALAVSAVVAQCAPAQAESVVKLPAAVTDPAVKAKRATAVLAGGCFWGVEGVFSNVKGVISVESGYHGGSAANAQYERTHDGKWGPRTDKH